MSDTDILRDLADGWHLCAAVGLAGHTAAVLADGSSIAMAVLALSAGRRRPALTLTASSCASWLAGALIHHGSLL